MKDKITKLSVALTFLAIIFGIMATFNLLDSLIK